MTTFIDHRTLAVPHLAVDSEIAEMCSAMAQHWLEYAGGTNKWTLNYILAAMEPDQVIALVTTIGGELCAGVSIIHDGQQPTVKQIAMYPNLSHDTVLGKALKLAEAYQQST